MRALYLSISCDHASSRPERQRLTSVASDTTRTVSFSASVLTGLIYRESSGEFGLMWSARFDKAGLFPRNCAVRCALARTKTRVVRFPYLTPRFPACNRGSIGVDRHRPVA